MRPNINPKNAVLVLIGLFLLIMGILFLCGCADQRERNERTLPVATSQTGGKYYVTTIEGCQYLACYTHNGFWVVTHKGNCTNSIHEHNR